MYVKRQCCLLHVKQVSNGSCKNLPRLNCRQPSSDNIVWHPEGGTAFTGPADTTAVHVSYIIYQLFSVPILTVFVAQLYTLRCSVQASRYLYRIQLSTSNVLFIEGWELRIV